MNKKPVMKPGSKTYFANPPPPIRGNHGALVIGPMNPANEAQSLDRPAQPSRGREGCNALEEVGSFGQRDKPWVRDLLLSALTVSSGAIDAISFLALGKVFSAFMTGNIAFLGLRVAGAPAPGAVAILVSVAAFAVGVSISTLVVKPTGGSGMWSQRVTVALGVSLIAHAVFLCVWFASNGEPSTAGAHVLLGSWALAMGMQSAAVRTLRVDGVFTTAATATVIFLVEDVTNGSPRVAERRRLAGVLISLFVGATAGGLLLVRAHLYAPVLPFAITLAAVTTAAIVLREPRKSH